jgi:hypothetical protein
VFQRQDAADALDRSEQFNEPSGLGPEAGKAAFARRFLSWLNGGLPMRCQVVRCQC